MNIKKKSKEPRISQVKKSAETRRRVIRSTLILLEEVGYERISLQMIAAHAEISRGAITHQFPTKNDVLVASYNELLNHWEAEWKRHDIEVPPITRHNFIKQIWGKLFAPKSYIAALELTLAARLDDELGKRLQCAWRDWSGFRDDKTRHLLSIASTHPEVEMLICLNRCALQGISTNHLFDASNYRMDELVSAWASLFEKELERILLDI